MSLRTNVERSMNVSLKHLASVLSICLFAILCYAEGTSQTNEQFNKLEKAREQTVERVLNLQAYVASPIELSNNAVRVEKRVTMSEKSGKIKMVSCRTFRGDRFVKDYIERDTNDDGEIDLFMEMFRVGNGVCVALTRRISGPGRGMSVHVEGLPHISAEFINKNSDGKFDELLLMKDDGEFIDLFRRDTDGLLQPVGADEYLKLKRGVEAIAPVTGAIINIIDSPKEKKQEAVPNNPVESAPTR